MQINDHVIVVNQYLVELTERQREILCRRFGWEGHKRQTLNEISYATGLTGERVRQLQLTALKELRHILIQRGVIKDDALPENRI